MLMLILKGVRWMPRKQIYVREEDEKMFERAVQLAGEESLSATVAEAVRRFVEQEEAKERGFGMVVLEVGSGGRTAANWKKVRFTGRLLAEGTQKLRYVRVVTPILQWEDYERKWGDFWPFNPDMNATNRAPDEMWESDKDNACLRQVYQTAKGKFLLYTRHYTLRGLQSEWAEYQVFDSLQEMRSADGIPLELLEMAAQALGEELIEDLDV